MERESKFVLYVPGMSNWGLASLFVVGLDVISLHVVCATGDGGCDSTESLPTTTPPPCSSMIEGASEMVGATDGEWEVDEVVVSSESSDLSGFETTELLVVVATGNGVGDLVSSLGALEWAMGFPVGDWVGSVEVIAEGDVVALLSMSCCACCAVI